MRLLKRLDSQLYVIVASVVALWFASFAASVHYWKKERAQQIVALEQERIGARLSAEASRILNDILLDHEQAIELTLQHLHRDLALTGIKLERPDGRVIGFGTLDQTKQTTLAKAETPISFEGRGFGKLVAIKSLDGIQVGGISAGLWVLGVGIVMCFLFWVIRSFIRHRIIVPIHALIASVGSQAGEAVSPDIGTKSQEMAELANSFSRMQKELQAYQAKVVDSERAQAHVEIASQVAHDIRSPLAALLSVNDELSELPEAKRLLVRSAIGRIQDIANNLLEGCQTIARREVDCEAGEEDYEVCLLSSLVDNLVSEKRAQHRSRLSVTISSCLEAESYGVFARVQPREFKRALSNLVDNAVEAIREQGEIRVQVCSRGPNARILVSDNGRGIPAEILPKLTAKGATFGKEKGNGLGLAHARAAAEQWGGRLFIESKEGSGTTVSFDLPRCDGPSWLVPRLAIPSGAQIVILDDDISIHHVWKKRIESIDRPGDRLTVRNFSSGTELLTWWSGESNESRARSLFLVDFELLGDQRSGLDIVRELGVPARSYLVTSRFEDRSVVDAARTLGVRIVPKGMAGFVPIDLVSDPPRQLDFALIDDDPVTRLSWTTSAETYGKKGLVFSDSDSFFQDAHRISKETPVYVDLQLGKGPDGVSVSRAVSAAGFTTVYIASGYVPEAVTDASWISGIFGKEPPWLGQERT